MISKKVHSIGVVIPTRNEEQNIGTLLESLSKMDIISQILVIDCSSTDNTVKIASEFAQVNAYQCEHLGACAARNFGLAKANGEYVKFLDSDDLLADGALSRQSEVARLVPKKTIIFEDLQYFDDTTGDKTESVIELQIDRPRSRAFEKIYSNFATPSSPWHSY